MADENEKDGQEAWDSGLKPRERKFVVFYCTDDECFMNGRKAFRKANTKYKAGEAVYVPADNVADTGASKLLSSGKVKSACRKLLAELQPDVDAENIPRLLHDLAVQAMYNPADIIDAAGALTVSDLHELGDLAKCISGIKSTDRSFEVRLYPRQIAQEKLLRYYNLVRAAPDLADTLQRTVQLVAQARSVDDWNRENGQDGLPVEATA